MNIEGQNMDEIEQLRYAFYRYWSKEDVKLVDKVWEKLVSEGNVEWALKEPVESALNVLLDDARPIVDGARMQKELYELPDFDDREPSRQGRLDERQETRPRLDALEQERAVAFEEHVARIAADDPLVRHYRDRVLDGKLLTAGRAQSLVSSPASWFLSREMFDRLGVPVGDQITGLVVEHERPGVNHGTRPDLTLRVEPPGVEVTEIRNLRLRALEFVSETDGSDLILVDAQSILGELTELVDMLAQAYPWPLREEITNFVLTGAPPSVPPVRASNSQKVTPYPSTSPFGGFEYTTITVTAAPWISSKYVEAAWREARREVSGDHKYRRIEEKGLKMIRFVAGFEEAPKGRSLLAAWNNTEWVKKNPRWSYDEGKPGESSRFWKDYHRARRALAYTKRSEIGDG
jgi:hypothetical protein